MRFLLLLGFSLLLSATSHAVASTEFAVVSPSVEEGIPPSLSLANILHTLQEDLTALRLASHQQTIKEITAALSTQPSAEEAAVLVHRILTQNSDRFKVKVLKSKYTKGIDIIKLMHEKILGLDHHFSSMETFQNINNITNPNSYPAFNKFKGQMKRESTGTVNQLLLNPALSNNIYLSAVTSILTIASSKKQDRYDQDAVGCILDFTLSMHTGLQEIYYETENLQAHSHLLKSGISELFEQYAGIVGYHTTLKRCRKEDDWEALTIMVDTYFDKQLANLEDPAGLKKAYKAESDVGFCINQIYDFVSDYTHTVTSTQEYYRRFAKILNDYSPEASCVKYLHEDYTDLKDDIDTSIGKFTLSYNIAELKGSKLKEVLYGTSY